MSGKDSEIEKRPQFGNRYLEDSKKVFEHNAWDNVTWDSEQEQHAKSKVMENSTDILPHTVQDEYEISASNYWDQFYRIHQNKFFKDRHWLFTEFPELVPKSDSSELISRNVNTSSDNQCITEQLQRNTNECYEEHENNAMLRILEIGCGVGNTVLPILEMSRNSNTFVFCCDFSSVAIDVLKSHQLYNPKQCHAFVCDVTMEDWDVPFPFESLDIVILIFVLSAINPIKMKTIAKNIFKYLKPGGLVVLRDYGRFDMAQLRFKKGHCLSENFYVRGDGTFVYFFTQEEITTLFTDVGFVEEYNLIDRRLQVNRGKLLKMYRVWIQAKYQKPLSK